MKKFLKFFALFLVLPLAFVFGGCKKDKDKDKGSGGGDDSQIEQPVEPENPDEPGTGGEDPENPDGPGTGGEDPDNPDGPGTGGEDPDDPDGPGTGGEDPTPDEPDPPQPPAETFFTVSFDYALPVDYDFLLEDYSVEKNTKETVALPTISDERLDDYFIGWFDKTTNNQISSSISGTANQTKNVYAKWNETALKKYYYTLGLRFVKGVDYLENEVAVISDFDSTAEIAILPQVVEIEGVELPVRIFAQESFKNTNVKKIVSNALEGVMIEDYAFADSKLETFDFSRVYSIGNYAFANSKLASVELGATVASVGEYAFANCLSLLTADLSKATQVNAISAYMFNNDASLETVKLASTIKTVGTFAFAGCDKISDTSFLSSVTTINNSAFADCDGLVSAVIPSSVITLGYDVFEGSEKLENLKLYKLPGNSDNTLALYVGEQTILGLKKIEILGSNVTEIPARYFSNLTNLEEVVIADSVTAIGEYAFGGCLKLAKLNLPNALDLDNFSFTSVNETAWYNNLTDILYFRNDEVLLFVPAVVSGNVVVKAGTKIIFDGAFINNAGIESVEIPSSVEKIGTSAFENCVMLESVVFEANNKIAAIENRTFFDCKTLSSINLSVCSNLSKLGDYAFANVEGFDTFNIPASVSVFGTRVFSGAKITAFVVDSASDDFSSVDGVVYNKDISTLYFYPALKEGKMFEIPETVSHVEDYAFEYNQYIENLYIVNYLTFGEGGRTNVFNKISKSRVNVYTENDSVTIADAKQIKIYRMIDETEFEWTTDYTNTENLTFLIEPEDLKINASATSANCFVRFVVGEDEYFWHFVLDVSGETISITSSKNLNSLIN